MPTRKYRLRINYMQRVPLDINFRYRYSRSIYLIDTVRHCIDWLKYYTTKKHQMGISTYVKYHIVYFAVASLILSDTNQC